MLKLMEALFTQEVPKFKGETVSTEDFYFNPKPVQQPHPPYIIGGHTDAALKPARRLGHDGDGVSQPLATRLELGGGVRDNSKDRHRAKRREPKNGGEV